MPSPFTHFIVSPQRAVTALGKNPSVGKLLAVIICTVALVILPTNSENIVKQMIKYLLFIIDNLDYRVSRLILGTCFFNSKTKIVETLTRVNGQFPLKLVLFPERIPELGRRFTEFVLKKPTEVRWVIVTQEIGNFFVAKFRIHEQPFGF